jgi:hypothetical protein
MASARQLREKVLESVIAVSPSIPSKPVQKIDDSNQPVKALRGIYMFRAKAEKEKGSDPFFADPKTSPKLPQNLFSYPLDLRNWV